MGVTRLYQGYTNGHVVTSKVTWTCCFKYIVFYITETKFILMPNNWHSHIYAPILTERIEEWLQVKWTWNT